MKTQIEIENALLGVIEEYEERANDWTNSLTGKQRETLLQVAVDLEQLIWREQK